MGAGVFEAVAGVGVTFAAAFIRADVGLFSWEKGRDSNNGLFDHRINTNESRESLKR